MAVKVSTWQSPDHGRQMVAAVRNNYLPDVRPKGGSQHTGQVIPRSVNQEEQVQAWKKNGVKLFGLDRN